MANPVGNEKEGRERRGGVREERRGGGERRRERIGQLSLSHRY